MNDIIKNHRTFVANQIEKSFDSGISISKELDIEKAKWKVGDEKQYQGATWVVGGFNAKGTPLWRKKKDGGSPAGGNATPSASSTQTQTNQSAPKQSAAPAVPQNTAPKQKTPKKDPTEKLIEDFAGKVGDSVQTIRRYLWKVQDRFYRYDLTDKEAIGVLRKFYKTKGCSSFDGWLDDILTVDAIGAKRMYAKK